jgi:hypothetical protein
MACEEERSEIAVILAEHGADLTLKNKVNTYKMHKYIL